MLFKLVSFAARAVCSQRCRSHIEVCFRADRAIVQPLAVYGSGKSQIKLKLEAKLDMISELKTLQNSIVGQRYAVNAHGTLLCPKDGHICTSII